MAHYRKPLARAAALNAAIFIVEAAAGFQAHSLCLVMDGIHNLSDEMALVLLYLAFVLSEGVSRKLLRSANMFSSVGLIAISGLLLWQAIEQFLHPVPVQGAVAIVVGIAAAVANWAWRNCFTSPAGTMLRFGLLTFTTWVTSTYRLRPSSPG
jgi:cobalt-zinc-cadmium efflux system protein